MTVNNSNSMTTIAGDGVTTTFTFNFVGASPLDLSVILDNGTASPLTLNPSQYILAMNPAAPGQLWGVGGTVVYPLAGSPLGSAHTLTIQRIVPMLQTVSLSNQGANSLSAVEQALDLVEMQIQQVSVSASQAMPGPPGAAGSAGAPGPVPRSYLAGFALSNDVSTPNITLDIAVGQCVSDDQSITITLASPFTKLINGLWVFGSGSAGLDAGTVSALTWYHVWVIYNPTLVTTDILFSLSATSPTLPSGYTKKRRLGSMKTDASAHILAFNQTGDRFDWPVPVVEFNGVFGGSLGTSRVLTGVPTGVVVTALLGGSIFDPSNSNAGIYLSSLAQTDLSVSNAGSLTAFATTAATTFCYNVTIVTDTSAHYRTRSNNSTVDVIIITNGWVDTRGRLS